MQKYGSSSVCQRAQVCGCTETLPKLVHELDNMENAQKPHAFQKADITFEVAVVVADGEVPDCHQLYLAGLDEEFKWNNCGKINPEPLR